MNESEPLDEASKEADDVETLLRDEIGDKHSRNLFTGCVASGVKTA
jgi:hypothetical protein